MKSSLLLLCCLGLGFLASVDSQFSFQTIAFTLGPSRLCPLNEVFDICGGLCEPNCDNPFPTCIPRCALRGRCVCKAGLYRSVTGDCVKGGDCFYENHPCANTVCLNPGATCVTLELPCNSPNPRHAPCPKVARCVAPGCL
ncbi:hypothetical protein L596_018277 [Steinernema carpocapsae]|uniref:TIL domain-containing protein n=1 Tax=Steinernema carpocapsae TaxID=34508 RepID=A0A4U5N4M3_STECR|nr:hypothetical protein L596_018277 [Steinernema carpocapsae]